jgi:MFS family permease
MEKYDVLLFKKMLQKKRDLKNNPRSMVYVLTFLYALHITPAVYINSSFLEQFTTNQTVGYVFSVASIFTVVAFLLSRLILQKLGNYKTFMAFMSLNTIALIILALSVFVNNDPAFKWIFIVAFIAASIARSLAFLNIDIFLEHVTKDSDTGGIRGVFLTALNFAFILGPLIASLLVKSPSQLGRVYIWGLLTSLFVMFIGWRYFRKFKDSKYAKSHFKKSLLGVFKHRDLSRIFIANAILRFFYSWMVIYTPIYLHTVIGFPLDTVAIIVGFGLIPFILLQLPLGRIADDKFGEKEILSIGFIITAFSTLAMAFIGIQNFWIWAAILFATRVGASGIEIMSETYLFKKIDDDDVDILSLYRIVRPVIYTFSPIIASVLLFYVEMSNLFIVLSLVVISGLFVSLTLKDTR